MEFGKPNVSIKDGTDTEISESCNTNHLVVTRYMYRVFFSNVLHSSYR